MKLSMRTTLTLDDDVAAFLKEQSRLRDVPFEQVVNDYLRRGMSPGAERSELPRFRVDPNPSGLVEGIDPMRLNPLSEKLEVDEFVEETVR